MMREKTEVVVANAKQMRHGKTALLVAVTNLDACIVSGIWVNAKDVKTGQQTDKVRHFNKHETQRGETIIAKDELGRKVGRYKIASIQMVDTVALTPNQIEALGYPSLEAFLEIEPGYRNRRAWYVQVLPEVRTRWIRWL